MHHNRLETYLDQVEQQLTRLPTWEREEWRDEARQHLSALAEAREELGWSPEAALEASLRQFGEPEQLGKELLASSSLAVRDRQTSARVAWSVHALSWNVLVTLVTLNLLLAQPPELLRVPAAAGTLAVFLLGQTLGGALLGWKVRDRHLEGAVQVTYLLMLALGLAGTGLAGACSSLALLAAGVSLCGGLALSTLASRWTRLHLPATPQPPHPSAR